jgi:hypothetical protein
MYIDAAHIESQYKEKKKKNHIYGVDRAATKILLVRTNQSIKAASILHLVGPILLCLLLL